MALADPLILLREFNVNKKEIVERHNQIIFGELAWPKNAKTNYPITDKKSSVKEYYTLESLLYFLKNITLFHPEYCKQAAEDNIKAVRRPDRKQLLAYLNGEIDTCASIDKSAPLEKPTQVKRTHDDDDDENPSAKQPRTEETDVHKIMDGKGIISEDPLILLREYNMNKKEVIEHDNQILFGKISWPKNVKTNYIMFAKTNKRNSKKEYYTLECLLYFLKHTDLFHPEYCKQAAEANMPAVRRPDRKLLLAYLNGEIDTCASIDKSAPLENI